jgi:dihydropteroate synthase
MKISLHELITESNCLGVLLFNSVDLSLIRVLISLMMHKNTTNSKHIFTLNVKGNLLVLNLPIVMGILNVTPDSFFDGSAANTLEVEQRRLIKMIDEGATIIDIGGQSTRPGAEQVGVEEELQRVLPIIKFASKNFPKSILSIDTFYAEVAEKAINAGASIVNDVSAGKIDPEIISIVAKLRVPYVLMHMKGTPKNMQLNPVYENVVEEVFDFLEENSAVLKEKGIKEVIIDPGFGFGKSLSDNFSLIAQLSRFESLKCPILAGISRKSLITKTLNIKSEEALNGTTALNMALLMNGASILRVHDVKEAVETVKLFNHL